MRIIDPDRIGTLMLPSGVRSSACPFESGLTTFDTVSAMTFYGIKDRGSTHFSSVPVSPCRSGLGGEKALDGCLAFVKDGRDEQ